MEAAEGYQILQIDKRDIEDEMIVLQYEMALSDNPGSVDRFNQALNAIARERKSSILLDTLHSAAPKEPQGTLEEPVGLENIGNTCYLNSLLQFLFTMNELRQLVLDFEKYKMKLDDKSMETKRVGQRKVSVKEVQSAQKFVDSLASLFHGMIQTPHSSIKPEQELARLTLETETVKEKMRRRSTLKSNERPSLGAIDNKPILGPLPEDGSTTNGVSESAIVQSPIDTDPNVDPLLTFDAAKIDAAMGKTASDDTTMDDNSSEMTLVSKPDSEQNASITNEPGQAATTGDKGNASPIKTFSSSIAASPWTGLPLEPTPTSRLNAQAADPTDHAADKATSIDPELMRFAPPPGKPPPIPPRKPVQKPTTTLEEYARQQDVTEVMNHCIIQLSYAMRPTGSDKSGEQRDEIHDLFFGEQIVHSQPQKEPPVTLPFLNIITRVFQRPTDVYAAVDNEFDLQDAQNGAKTYTSITGLPPVLSIALDRVSWNNETKRQEKLNHHVDVPETIYMDRYLESPPESDLTRRRQQTWEIKKELSSLTTRRDELEEKYV